MKGYGIILLQQALKRIDAAPLDHLLSVPFVEHIICDVGVLTDNRPLYGDYYPFSNSYGMLQSPFELSRFLIWLSDKSIKTYVEVGLHYGTTWNVITAYLRRFGLTKSYGIDPHKPVHALWYDEMEYLKGTTYDHKLTCDLVFIDGDHRYDWAEADYANTSARLYAFHDIYDDDVAGAYHPSCADFYHAVKGNNFIEFNYKQGSFGIGVMYE